MRALTVVLAVAAWRYLSRPQQGAQSAQVQARPKGSQPWELIQTPYASLFEAADRKHGLPPGLTRRVAWQESHFDPSARSPAGALGIMQFKPSTARDFGINPLDPMQAIDAAGRYLASLYKQTGSWRGAIASYNWGIGNYLRKGMAAAPLETRNYMSIADDLGL